MAAGTKKRQVRKVIILPVAINVLDLNWNTPSAGVSLGPSTLRALLAKLLHEVVPERPEVTERIVGAGEARMSIPKRSTAVADVAESG